MKRKLFLISAFAALLAVPQTLRADEISEGTKTGTYQWTALTSKTQTAISGTTLTLGSLTMTLQGENWNKYTYGLVPSAPPRKSGTSTNITSVAIDTDLTDYINICKFVTTTGGTLVMTVRENAQSAKYYFVKVDNNNKVTELTFSGTAPQNTASSNSTYYIKLDANATYLYVPCSSNSTGDGGRSFLAGLTFGPSSDTYRVWNFLEDADTWKERTATGTYDNLQITSAATWESALNGNATNRYTAGTFQFAPTGSLGYLAIQGKYPNSGSITKAIDSGDAAAITQLRSSSGVVSTELVEASTSISIALSSASLFAISWVPLGSDKFWSTYEVEFDTNGYATYAPAFTVQIPSGVTAYYFTALNTSTGTVTAVARSTYIPAHSAVLLKGPANTKVKFLPYTQSVSALGATAASGTVSKMHPAYKSGITSDGNYYAYSKSKGKFVKVKSGTAIPEGKGYFKISDGGAAGAREFFDIVLDDSETTGIHSVNGSRLTVNGSNYYDLSGRRVENPTRGLYIVNGKKIVIK